MPDVAGPVYRHVARILAGGLGDGTYAPGDRLPSEREFAERLGVSRMTVRAAYDMLVDLGLVERRDRVGAFAARPKLVFDLRSTAGLTAQLRAQGARPGAVVREATEVSAGQVPAEVAGALDLAEADVVYRIVRLRTADREPVVLEETWLLAAAAPGLLDHDLSGSLYDVLAEHYGISPGTSEQELEVAPLGIDEAALLGTTARTPAFHLRRSTRDVGGTTVEFARDLFRGDRFRLRVEVPPTATSPLPG